MDKANGVLISQRVRTVSISGMVIHGEEFMFNKSRGIPGWISPFGSRVGFNYCCRVGGCNRRGTLRAGTWRSVRSAQARWNGMAGDTGIGLRSATVLIDMDNTLVNFDKEFARRWVLERPGDSTETIRTRTNFELEKNFDGDGRVTAEKIMATPGT
uniref:Uncharacterized protein n=1 Tax=Compsopogon caeruleus TaxID=31354 RepID=A0A6T6BD84_9RHOD|mmetsp:Transcript_15107/g.30694  ORF Transcript_15107/g.30694 Transcript_15107/m.30694 type:complete len:156 (+) Transcript_15107:291-758(+)